MRSSSQLGVEAVYAQDHSPVIDLMAQEGIAALARALPAIMARLDDLDARAVAAHIRDKSWN